jgi:hypothetical protein
MAATVRDVIDRTRHVLVLIATVLSADRRVRVRAVAEAPL